MFGSHTDFRTEIFCHLCHIFIIGGDNYTALEGYPQAIQHYQKAYDMIPNRLYPHYLLAKMYEKQENFTKAKQEATIILQMPVKIPSIATYQIREEMKELLRMNDKPDTK